MFKIIKNKFCNLTLGPPADWAEKHGGECLDLPCHRPEENPTGFHSWWVPGIKDRIKILIGVPIRLHVVGASHPPVCLETCPDYPASLKAE